MRVYMFNDINVMNKQNAYELRYNGKLVGVLVMKNDGQLYEDDLAIKKITEIIRSYIKGGKTEARIPYMNRGIFFRQIPGQNAFGIYFPTGAQIGWISLGKNNGSFIEESMLMEKIIKILSHRYFEV